MKKLLTILIGSLLMSQVSVANTKEIRITVENIDLARGGNIIAMIFAEDGFPKKHDKAVFSKTLSADSETLEFKFNLDMPDMAVKILHDEDMNGKVTKNWSGIYPKEGLGFSNKQKVTFTGAPTYKKSKQTIEQYKNGLTISIIYP